MGSYKDLIIDRELIKTYICEYFSEKGQEYTIEEFKEIDSNTGLNRCTLKVDEKEVKLNFYFKKKNKTSILPTGNEYSKEVGTGIAEHIQDNSGCKEMRRGYATIEGLLKEHFIVLRDYLNTIEGVTFIREDDSVNNNVGHLIKISNQMGDTVTLIYYYRSKKLICQGDLFRLFSEVTSFVTGIGLIAKRDISDTEVSKDNIELMMEKLLPNAYTVLNSNLKDFIYDSCMQINMDIQLKDYSVMTFPALKGLEGFIKMIFFKKRIRINDMSGFRINGQKIFVKNVQLDTHSINDDVVALQVLSVEEKTALSELYSYFNKNRHTLFHTKQMLNTSRKLSDKSDADIIVYKVCELFDKYYQLV